MATAITGALFAFGAISVLDDRRGLAVLFVALGALNAWAC